MAVAGLCKKLLLPPPLVNLHSSEGKGKQLLLPPPLVDLYSSEGQKLLKNGKMEGFHRLNYHFRTQSKRTCGLTSLAMALNALGIAPGENCGGSDKLFDEATFNCYESLEKVKDQGLSFRKLVHLAKCAGANVKGFRTNESNIDDFRKYVMHCSTGDSCHVISNFYRPALNQIGTGHFSPIGGYHMGRDMALILDVARFKYPPYWVPLTHLWKAMNCVDSAGQCRGFILLSRPQGVENLCTYLQNDSILGLEVSKWVDAS